MLRDTIFLLCSATLPIAGMADAQTPEKKAELCLLCHRAVEGKDNVPILAGQPRQYFINQIDAFKNHRRTDMAMITNAASLSDQDTRDLAEFFARQKPAAYPIYDADRATLGKKVLRELSCDTCHGSSFAGQTNTPRLAGQTPKYTAWQLRSFKGGTRNHPMTDASAALKSLPDDQIDSLAHAFASME